MAYNGASSPAYHRVLTPNSDPYANDGIVLFVIIDSKAPIIIKVPRVSQMTLGLFKDHTSLHSDSYKFFFQTHDAEFGTVREELIKDDELLPIDDGRVVAWVLSGNSAQSNTLFEPVAENQNLHRLEDAFRSNNMMTRVDHASVSPRGRRELFVNSQPPSPNHSHNSFTFANHQRSTLLESPTRVVVSLHLDPAQPLGIAGDDCQTQGIIVDHVQQNSVAHRDGRIQIGDRIVEVNGIDLRSHSLGEATRIFRQHVAAGGKINLVLQRLSNSSKAPPLPPTKTLNHYPRVPPMPPARNSPMNLRTQQVTTANSSNFGFDPATELPDPIIDTVDSKTPCTRAQPIVNFHRSDNQREHQRVSQSLPRSLTPRSLYTTGNLENSTSNLETYHVDSRSDYEPTTSASLRSNLCQSPLHCGKDSIKTIYAALKADSASLEVKDREWLKVVVKDAFIGATLIKWLCRNIYGFCNRSEVKRFANQMLALGLIRSPISKATFSEKCFYTLS